jgi:hypothetical protein
VWYHGYMNKEWIEAQILEIEQLIENATALLNRLSPDSESYARNFDRRADYFKALRIAKGML